jgi:hypothetical protein
MRKKVKRRKLWVFPSDSHMGWNTIFDGMDKSERSPAVAIEFLDWRRINRRRGPRGENASHIHSGVLLDGLRWFVKQPEALQAKHLITRVSFKSSGTFASPLPLPNFLSFPKHPGAGGDVAMGWRAADVVFDGELSRSQNAN